MHSDTLTTAHRCRARLCGGAALALALLAATPLSAQLIDLDITTGAPACDATIEHGVALDTAADVDETIQAQTDNVGDNVFWVLTYQPAGSTVACAAMPPSGFTTSLDCENGVTITLPAGASEAASVAASLPVQVAIDPFAGGDTVGEAAFTLQATLDGGAFPTCEQLYSVTRNEVKQVFDLVYVLDRSGSMGSAAGAVTRWEALQWGTNIFNTFVQEAAQAPTPAGSQFGVTFFQSSVDPATTPLTAILSGNAPSPESAGLPGLIAAQSPGGTTAMGQGLQDALGKLTATDRNKVVVLFTDGEQNVPPDVSSDGCNFSPPGAPICSSGVKICAVGINNPSSPYMTTLQNLSANNSCGMVITDNGTGFKDQDGIPVDIGSALESTIGMALEGNSPQQVARYSGNMVSDPSAPAPVVLPTFDVNDNVENVMLSFAFSQRFETPQLLQLLSGMTITRDGTPVQSEFTPVIGGNFSGVLTLVSRAHPEDAPVRDLAGTYEVTLTLPTGFKPDLEFRLAVYVEDVRIRTDSTFGQVPAAGGTVDVSVQLDYLNLGIEGATVVVRAFTPGADMGELLSQGGPVDLSSAPDAGNPGVQKYEQLAANDPNFLAQLALSPNAIAMTDAGGGRYTGSFTVPDNVGVVHFVYDVVATGALFGSLQRHWMESKYAGFDRVDLAGSNPSWAQGDSGLVLTFTPVRPPSGKKVGPGNGGAFSFEGANVVAVEDLQDGGYRYTLDTTDPDTPIKVGVFGNPVYDGPVRGWGMGPPKGPLDILLSWPWWLILLLILLLLLLLIWWWRRPAGA